MQQPTDKARRAPVGLVQDRDFELHRGPAGHPERPERLDAVADALAPFSERFQRVDAREAEQEELASVHSLAYLESLESHRPSTLAQLDADTYWGPDSLRVASLAAGSATELALRVARGELSAGLAAIRPPGHHAEGDRAMGFCLYNNVAIAAESLRREKLAEKVMIVDWDVHHGNGTQHHFESDPTTLFASTHQFPFYPGTGSVSEAGSGKGVGATVNIPLAAGCGDTDYLTVFHELLAPAARSFAPDFILVSSGFDAHRDDPLAQMRVTADGFSGMARTVRTLADELCGGRWVALLEGGYAASGLRAGVQSVAEALLAETVEVPEVPVMARHPTLEGVLEAVSTVHSGRISNP